MNDYVPTSTLGWLDLDTAASERVTTLLRSLEEPSTLDVLGLGTIRDAFANMLSPGTSTVQTRLRYFIFLPWIFQRLEAKQVQPADFARRLREAEAGLIDCLRHLGPRQGVIGYRAGRDLRRMPSDVYWGGLVAWGIRRLSRSPADNALSAAATRRRLPELDDDRNATASRVSMWADLPPAPDGFLEKDTDFQLSPDEANFLIGRIGQTQPNSLLAVLSESPSLHIDVDYPWFVEQRGLRDRLAEVLHHARCFSELALGPQLIYSLLLARQANDVLGWDTKELQEKESIRLEEWVQMVADHHLRLSSWVDAPADFRQVLAPYNISDRTLGFWSDMARRAVDEPGTFAEDREIHRLVYERERHLKRRRARLSHTAALEKWGGGSAADQLDYRWHITKRYVHELAEAEA